MRLIFTSPLVRSPYSTEGMPCTISTAAISSVGSVRMSIPALSDTGTPLSLVMPLDREPPYCIAASFESGRPSMTNETPSDEVA